MKTKFLRIDLVDMADVEGTGEVPARAHALIEFYKKVKEQHEVIGVEIDEAEHILSFIVKDKQTKEAPTVV